MNCANCGGSGVLVAIPRSKDWGQFGFRCNCPVGRAKSCVAIPLWSTKYAAAYEISALMVAPPDEEPEDKSPEDLF